MKVAEIEVGQDYVVKEGSYPSAGTIAFSTLYRFHVTALEQRSSGVRPDGQRRRDTWRVVGYKCRNDGSVLYFTRHGPVLSDFSPSMVLERWA